jgi:hypothetical protein
MRADQAIAVESRTSGFRRFSLDDFGMRRRLRSDFACDPARKLVHQPWVFLQFVPEMRAVDRGLDLQPGLSAGTPFRSDFHPLTTDWVLPSNRGLGGGPGFGGGGGKRGGGVNMQAAMQMIPKPIELTPPNIQQTRVLQSPSERRSNIKRVLACSPAVAATFPDVWCTPD